jgi:hypothetical protein
VEARRYGARSGQSSEHGAIMNNENTQATGVDARLERCTKGRAGSFMLLRAAAGLLLAVLGIASASFAQSDAWKDSPANGVWSQSANWMNAVPTATSDVRIGVLGQPVPPTTTLDVNATVNSLNLAGTGTQLVLQGDSAVNPTAAVNLTVAPGTTTVGAGAQLNIGPGASLTVNGAASNQGTINLSTITIIVGEAPAIGKLNGSGTLSNNGTIQGSGVISVNVNNTAQGVLTGNLALNGVTVTGGGYVLGNLSAGHDCESRLHLRQRNDFRGYQ